MGSISWTAGERGFVNSAPATILNYYQKCLYSNQILTLIVDNNNICVVINIGLSNYYQKGLQKDYFHLSLFTKDLYRQEEDISYPAPGIISINSRTPRRSSNIKRGASEAEILWIRKVSRKYSLLLQSSV